MVLLNLRKTLAPIVPDKNTKGLSKFKVFLIGVANNVIDRFDFFLDRFFFSFGDLIVLFIILLCACTLPNSVYSLIFILLVSILAYIGTRRSMTVRSVTGMTIATSILLLVQYLMYLGVPPFLSWQIPFELNIGDNSYATSWWTQGGYVWFRIRPEPQDLWRYFAITVFLGLYRNNIARLEDKREAMETATMAGESSLDFNDPVKLKVHDDLPDPHRAEHKLSGLTIYLRQNKRCELCTMTCTCVALRAYSLVRVASQPKPHTIRSCVSASSIHRSVPLPVLPISALNQLGKNGKISDMWAALPVPWEKRNFMTRPRSLESWLQWVRFVVVPYIVLGVIFVEGVTSLPITALSLSRVLAVLYGFHRGPKLHWWGSQYWSWVLRLVYACLIIEVRGGGS